MFLLGWALVPDSSAANPFVHPLFTSHMVLQRDAADPVWGWTTAGNSVTVTVTDQNSAVIQTGTAVAAADGRWQTTVGPFGLVANNAAYSIAIASAGQTTVTLTDVLIGDVFLCSGQSNMDYSLNTINVYNLAAEIADSANYPSIRQFYVTHTSTRPAQQTIPAASWLVAGPANTGIFSATAYFTAREIYKQQGVPVGILCSAWAGTEIKLWLDPDYVSTFADYTQPLYDRAATDNAISGAYNGMIAPLAPMRFKATIWYQGEFNSSWPEQYSRLLPALMSKWRSLFEQPNLPFIIVQLVNSDSYSGLREAQFNTVKNDPNSRLITILDVGESTLHPRDKQDVGLRAARAAANLVYQQNVAGQGPMFTGATISGSTMRCSFSDVGAGLMVGLKTINTSGPQTPVQAVVGGTLTGFTIAGSNGTYYTANATIDAATNTVVVSSASVPSPVYVRYAWTNTTPAASLYGKITDAGGTVLDGLPASSFRNSPTYLLTVNSGNGTGYYSLGAQASISAPSLTGQSFHHWSGDTAALSSTTNATTTATISQTYTTVLANYQITGAPTGLAAATPAQLGQVTLSWTPMTAVHFNLKRSTSLSGSYTTIAPDLSGTTSYVDTSVSAGTTYYYLLSASNLLGEGPNSAAISAAPAMVVGNVGTVAASAQTPVTWDAFNGPVDSYTIKRSTSSGGPYTTIATGVTSLGFTDQSVLAGVTYYYVVTAVSRGTESLNSKEIVSRPTFLPPPMQDADIGSVTIPGGAYAGLSGTYTVLGSGLGVSGTSNDSLNFAYNSTPITGDCTITAHIVSLVNGASSSEAGVMIRQSLTNNCPYVRTYLSTTQTCYQGRGATGASPGTSVTTSTNRWVRIVRTSNSCKGYVSPDGATWTQQGTPVTVSGSAYAGFVVCSRNAAVVNATVFDNLTITPAWTLQTPPVPTGLTATLTTNSLHATLNWNAAAGAIGYNVKQATVSGGPYTTVASGTNSVNYSCAGLTGGSNYYYVVSAIDSAGEGANSAETVVHLPLPVMTIPADMTVPATSSSGCVVNFAASSTDAVSGSLPVTSSPASGSVFPIGATTVTVTATDPAGNIARQTFTITVNLPALMSLAATALSESQIQLTWANNVNYATVCAVERSPANANLWTALSSTLPGNCTSYTDAGLTASTSYDYRVQCLTTSGSSAWATLSATTPAGVGDGIAGWWRLLYFGNGLSSAGSAADTADPDGDGVNNLKEYLSGTNPLDRDSILRILSIVKNGGDVVLTFNSVAGKFYTVRKAPSLQAGAVWSVVLDNVAGTGSPVSVTDPGATAQSRSFYQVVVK